MNAKRALIVDDSKSARLFLTRMLEKYELDVDTTETAELAIDYLAHHRPDVIFMDHLMPGMDGFQALQAIKNNPHTATIPIMMYTSQEGELYLGQARALGAVGVLPKQIKPADVSKVLVSTAPRSRPAHHGAVELPAAHGRAARRCQLIQRRPPARAPRSATRRCAAELAELRHATGWLTSISSSSACVPTLRALVHDAVASEPAVPLPTARAALLGLARRNACPGARRREHRALAARGASEPAACGAGAERIACARSAARAPRLQPRPPRRAARRSPPPAHAPKSSSSPCPSARIRSAARAWST